MRVGRASDKQITQRPFSDVYGDYPGHRTWLALDVGLVELDELGDWTSQTYGLPHAHGAVHRVGHEQQAGIAGCLGRRLPLGELGTR